MRQIISTNVILGRFYELIYLFSKGLVNERLPDLSSGLVTIIQETIIIQSEGWGGRAFKLHFKITFMLAHWAKKLK